MGKGSPRVLILYNQPSENPSDPFRESEQGVMEEVQGVSEALTRLGIAWRSVGVSSLDGIPPVLTGSPEEIIFNLVEGFRKRPNDSNLVPALCESHGKGCTGCDTQSLILTQDKWQTKSLLLAEGLPCTPGVLLRPGERIQSSRLPSPPYLVKPACCDASEGIDRSSFFSRLCPRMRNAVKRIHEKFRQPALIESYVGERELNVSLLQEGERVRVLPIAEIDFSAFGKERPRIVDYAAKWLPHTFEYQNTPRIIPAPLTAQQRSLIHHCAITAWRATGCRDYARVDFRLDAEGRPFILEVNANPDISPGAGFAAAIEAAELSYDDFVKTVIGNALARRGLAAGSKSASSQAGRARPKVAIRRTLPQDREIILEFAARTGRFRPDEIEVAKEVLDDALSKGESGHYQSFVAVEDGRPVGWVCFGPTPCTLGTFDIYWIAVAPERQGRGIGAALIHHAESLIAQRGGRMTVVETSGAPANAHVRQFYIKMGYREAARIPDFYTPGDAKVILTKTL